MHIRLVDSNSLGHALHHGIPGRQAQGNPTQAVYGVLDLMRRWAKEPNPALSVFLWDGRAQWRYDLLPEYKSGRHRLPEQVQARAAYESQVPSIQRLLATLPCFQLKHPNAEADDLAYGLARNLSAQGHRVTLYTADTDWLQLVSARVLWVSARSPHKQVQLEGFSRMCDFPTPGLVAAVKALAGDSSDDIPGVPDIGDKRALALLARFGSLGAVVDAAQDFLSFSQEPKYHHHLMLPEQQDRLRRNLQLIDLSKGPALEGTEVELTEGAFQESEFRQLIEQLEFQDVLASLPGWQKGFLAPVSKADGLSFKRAVQSLARAWQG